MYTTTTLREATLRSLLDNSKRFLSSELVDKMGDNILQEVVKGISGGLTPTDVIKSMGEITGTLETQVVTAYGQYSNAVANMLSEKLPDNTKFIYIGAHDIKTRDRCVEKIGFSPATRESIIGRFGDMENEIWNCRHSWEQMSSSPEDQGYNKEKYIDA